MTLSLENKLRRMIDEMQHLSDEVLNAPYEENEDLTNLGMQLENVAGHFACRIYGTAGYPERRDAA